MQKEGNTELMNTVNPAIFNDMNEQQNIIISANDTINKTIEVEESLSLFDQEKRLIEKSLLKHKGKRKDAAAELGISERTLYRKLKEFGL
jgi:transcriptional regulator with PAS, ATPase and Fis domain